jgi:hypothetical protein
VGVTLVEVGDWGVFEVGRGLLMHLFFIVGPLLVLPALARKGVPSRGRWRVLAIACAVFAPLDGLAIYLFVKAVDGTTVDDVPFEVPAGTFFLSLFLASIFGGAGRLVGRGATPEG